MTPPSTYAALAFLIYVFFSLGIIATGMWFHRPRYTLHKQTMGKVMITIGFALMIVPLMIIPLSL